MFLIVIFALSILACTADPTVAPPPPVQCGETPSMLFACMGNPRIIQTGAYDCSGTSNECESLTCVYRKAGWLKDGAVKKQKVISYLTDYAKEHPVWSAAVEYAKTACLTQDLPPQGSFINCPAYDVTTCVAASFIKYTPESQWSVRPQCGYSKQFAAACPYCPSSCFAPLIPTGSCNACYGLPRSP